MNEKKIAIVVPTLNAGKKWDAWIASVKNQLYQINKVLVIDSDSTDGTREKAIEAGFDVIKINRTEFGHGITRQKCVEELNDYSILIFLTQDAILCNENAVEELIKCFDDPEVAAAYGRQLPHKNATIIEAHARIFNYPDDSYVRKLEDKKISGIKTVFISNSFAAYRRKYLQEVGGFPKDTILGEDTYVVAKMLLAGKKVAYCSQACVYHSHNYTMFEEFKRYFDTGAFHSRENWILNEYGSAEGSGGEFVKSEFRYLLHSNPLLIPGAIIRTILRYTGYLLGRKECYLPAGLKRKLSMHPYYWRTGKYNDV